MIKRCFFCNKIIWARKSEEFSLCNKCWKNINDNETSLRESIDTSSALIEKEQIKKLKEHQKFMGKEITKIIEKENPEIKGKFKIKWDECK